MERLVFGTAGIPIGTDERNTVNGIRKVRELGLGAMELEFVHSITVTERMTPDVKKAAKDSGVVLTCHAPYFINLNSPEKAKLEASKKRILSSAERLNECGGWSVCFHPGFYLGMEKESVWKNVRDAIKEISETVKNSGNNVWLRPELTGKPTQFGTLEELLKISQEMGNVMPCIDFSHNHARSNGAWNSYKEFSSMLELVEKHLGKKGLQNMHIHVSGIEYGEKGEKNHLLLQESDMDFVSLMKAFRDFHVSGVVICESPNIEGDALLMKQVYENPEMKVNQAPKTSKRPLAKFVK